MGFKELLERMKEKKEMKKDMFKKAEAQLQIQKLLEERQKSANQRELERYMKEDEEKNIKENLEYYRAKRQQDISHNHNPLDTKNVTTHSDWEILKNKSIFKGDSNSSMLKQKNIFVHNAKIR